MTQLFCSFSSSDFEAEKSDEEKEQNVINLNWDYVKLISKLKIEVCCWFPFGQFMSSFLRAGDFVDDPVCKSDSRGVHTICGETRCVWAYRPQKV